MKNRQRYRQVTIRMKPETHKQFKQNCFDDNISLNARINELICMSLQVEK